MVQIAPHLKSVDDQGTTQKVDSKEDEIQQGGSLKKNYVTQVATLSGTGAALGGFTDHSWTGAGIGAGVGAGVGMATVLVTRGREVDLRQGSMVDVVFDKAVAVE